MAGDVLVLTGRLDPTADLVVAELDRRGVPVFRCDIADFPQRLNVAAEFDGTWTGSLRTATRILDLARVRSAYYRRPTGYELRADLSGADRGWALAEAEAGFGGLLAAIPNWFNHPGRTRHAEHKPVQLAAAAAAGLRTPRTLLTNDPQTAATFAERVGQIVYKPFSTPSVAVEGETRFVYTNVVGPSELPDATVAHTAHLFQEQITKDHEVRLTVVDGRYFAARLRARSAAAAVDWRSDYDAIDYAVTEPTGAVRTAVGRMLGSLGLRFAAIDFAVTPDGDWVFFDLNPNGQWAWIEHETGLPICAAIADALEGQIPEPTMIQGPLTVL